jgi:ABC-type antimicrobial peptide transport system permease subunit
MATVVGVADDAGGNDGQLRIFVGFGSLQNSQAPLIMRAAGKAVPQANIVGAVLRDIPGLSATNARLRTSVNRVILQVRRYLSLGFTLFAIIGLVLASIGTYGVVAYSVVRRTHEIGVRMALGADRRAVVAMILEQGLRLTLIGLALGLLLALAAARLIDGLVEDMTSNYPIAIAAIILLVGAVSIVASAIPGWRAGRLNPVDCLRAE